MPHKWLLLSCLCIAFLFVQLILIVLFGGAIKKSLTVEYFALVKLLEHGDKRPTTDYLSNSSRALKGGQNFPFSFDQLGSNRNALSFTDVCIEQLKGYAGQKSEDQRLIEAVKNEFGNSSWPLAYNAKLCTEDIVMIYGFGSCYTLPNEIKYIIDNYINAPWFNHQRIYAGINASRSIGCCYFPSNKLNACAFADFPREEGYEEMDTGYTWRNHTECENDN